jgi:hypothetical protein
MKYRPITRKTDFVYRPLQCKRLSLLLDSTKEKKPRQSQSEKRDYEASHRIEIKQGKGATQGLAICSI